jgi:hypothetical protein
MIIFGSILTTFELRSILGDSWAVLKNWLEPKNRTIIGKFSLPIFLKRSVEVKNDVLNVNYQIMMARICTTLA